VTDPLVSVVVPVHDGERFLAAALESALAQDHPRLEVIVVDDGSRDGSADVASSYPVRLLRQPNRGVAAARNAGLAAARGELIAFLDQDDEWTPDKIRRQVGHLLNHPELDFVLAHMRAVLEPGVEKPPWLPSGWLDAGERGMLPGTLVARRRAFERIGLFDPAYEVSSDTEWLVRARDAGLRFDVLPDVLLRWRVHGANASFRREDTKADLLRALRASVGRKRTALEGSERA
jgi:glycosyltransferase involved in cell wall biosynthesis